MKSRQTAGGLAVVLVTALSIALAAGPAAAVGTLSATISPVTAPFGVLRARADNPGLALGTLTVTDTLADTTPTAWVVQVAASACTLPASGIFANVSGPASGVPPTDLTITPGPVVVVTAAGGAGETTPTAGPSATFGAAVGSGFSAPITIATGPAGALSLDNNGVFTQTATLDVNLSGLLLAPGTFTCTLQYTITG